MTLYLGLDIGGTKIAGGLVTDRGQVLVSRRVPTPLTGRDDLLAALIDLARSLMAEAPTPPVGIGVGTGGQVDSDRGVVVDASSLLPGWTGTDIRGAVQGAFGLPVYVDNDVNALAAGEARFGAAGGRATVVFLALGTGVGGALLLEGRVHHGAHWSGGEFGHVFLASDEESRRKTLEEWAAGPALVQTWREITGSTAPMTAEDLAADAIRVSDGAAAKAIRRTGEALGFGLAGLANALDPDLIVIGGGLAAVGDPLLEPARRILRQYGVPGAAQCPVVLASLGANASLIGAACLAMGVGTHLPRYAGTPPETGGGRVGQEGTAGTEGTAALPSSPLRFGEGGEERAGRGSFPAPPELGAGRTLTLALVPLDERPVNTHYPQLLGAIGGARVLLPPPEIRGFLRYPADTEAVAAWLREAARSADAAIVSCEFLGFGNLINARISQDNAADVLARLRLLADLNPACPVHAFSLITRVANSDDAVEEPEYWALWGTKFSRYARLTHQAEAGALMEADADELARLDDVLPADLKADWLTRRLRNHAVTLGLLDMTARGQITALRLTSDDTSPFGFPSRERDWLAGWPRLVGPALTERLMMHPGADEVGSALLSHLLMGRREQPPRVWILYSHPDDKVLVAPYEDRPVRETVEGQIAACGCALADTPEECDFVLGVATPSPRRTDYRPEYLAEDRRDRMAAYRAFLADLGQRQSSGQSVALADVAYPNGSDPLLTELLLSVNSPLAPGRLTAYGAWNTAGNTLGVVVAQAACAGLIGDNLERELAQRLFLTHRFLEDWGYQAVTRRLARAEAERLWGRREPDPDSPDEQAALCAFIAECLAARLGELQRSGVGVGLTLGNVRLPWWRTFEVDFGLAED